MTPMRFSLTWCQAATVRHSWLPPGMCQPCSVSCSAALLRHDIDACWGSRVAAAQS